MCIIVCQKVGNSNFLLLLKQHIIFIEGFLMEIKKALFILLIIVSLFFLFSTLIKQKTTSLEESPLDKYFLNNSYLKDNLEDFYKVFPKEIPVSYESHTENNEHLHHALDKIRANMATPSDKDIHILDQAVIALVKDHQISRDDKINGLWSLVKEMGISSTKGIYLLDYLAALSPIELVDELIAAYSALIETDVKIKIMDLLYESLSIANPSVQTEEQLRFIAEKTEAVKIFLYDEITKGHNDQVFHNAIMSYSKIASPEETRAIIDSLMARDNHLDRSEFISVLAESALSTPESQDEILFSMIDAARYDSFDEKSKEAFDSTMIDAINGTDGAILTDTSRLYMSDYLASREPNPSESGSFVTDYYLWIKAMSHLRSNDSNGYIEEYLFLSLIHI
jgi:hypothetical protein